jgi:aminoglycoside phosphotransferase (APT) family kinase protein
MHDPEHPLDPTALTRQLDAWLRATLPATARPRVSELHTPGGNGFSSETLLFTLDWQQEGAPRHERLVARLAPRGFAVFPSYDIGRQAWVMRALAETDVPVPRVRWSEESAGWLGSPFYVMDYVDGRVPADVPPMHVGGWVAELARDERTAMWWSGLAAMAKVHAVDWQALGLGRLADPARGPTPLAQQLRYYDEFFSWGLERARYPLLEAALRYLRRAEPPDQPVGLCWGDARLGNQIFDGTRCVAVLDWEMVNLGNPVADLAWWIALDRCFSEGVGAERLEGFPGRQETIARWEALTGRRAEHFAYYEVFALLRFNVVLSRVVQHMKQRGLMDLDDSYDRENLGTEVLARALREAGG